MFRAHYAHLTGNGLVSLTDQLASQPHCTAMVQRGAIFREQAGEKARMLDNGGREDPEGDAISRLTSPLMLRINIRLLLDHTTSK